MTDRRRRIVMLLGSLDDLLPGPKGSLRTVPGLAPGERTPCGSCGGLLVRDDFGKTIRRNNGTGWRVDRFNRRVPCELCGGHTDQHGKPVKGRGWVAVDRMDAQKAAIRTETTTAKPTRPPATRRCDACGGSGEGGMHLDPQGREYRGRCDYCGGSGRRVIASTPMTVDAEAPDVTVALEAQLDRRAAQGSYRELDWALDSLAADWLRVLRAVHITRQVEENELDVYRRMMLEASLAAIDFLMPADIRVPAQVRAAFRRAEQEQRTRAYGRGAGRQLIAQRDKEIRKLDREGKPRQWIAREYGVTVATVKRIVNGGQEDAA